MSILGALQNATAVVSDFILIRPLRSIAGFTANVTILERHSDDTEITEQPVEQGAAITDHAYNRPSQLSVEIGYSNSSIEAGFDPNYVSNMYAQFLNLKASRVPFEVFTGKRHYVNMLIKTLAVTTDEKTENALIMRIDMKQLLIVTTQVVTVPDSSVMANPEKTGATQNTGTQQLAPGTAYNSQVGAS